MSPDTKQRKRELIKAIAMTYLLSNRTATSAKLAEFINNNKLLYSRGIASSREVSRVLKSSKRGTHKNIFRKASVAFNGVATWELNNEN